MKHYDDSGRLASFETKSAMLKMFPDGLDEVPLSVAKEFSSYIGTHNYVEGAWIEKVKTNEDIAASRDSAYSDVHTGSDKYFQEATVKRAMSDEAGALAAETKGLARRAEIQAEHPFNE